MITMNIRNVLVLLLLVLYHCDPSWAAKDRNEAARIPDKDKTLEDWLLIRKKALDLRINTLHLPHTSSHRAAAEYLYHYYHPSNPVQQPNPPELQQPDYRTNNNLLPPPNEPQFTFSPPTIPVLTSTVSHNIPINTSTQSARADLGSARRRPNREPSEQIPPTATSQSVDIATPSIYTRVGFGGARLRTPTITSTSQLNQVPSSSQPSITTNHQYENPSTSNHHTPVQSPPRRRPRTDEITSTNIPTIVNPVVTHVDQNHLNAAIQQQIMQSLPTIISQVISSTNAILTGATSNVAPTRDRGHRNPRRRRHHHRRYHESPSSSDDSSDEDVANLVTEDGTPLPPAHAGTVRLIRAGKFVDLFRLLPRSPTPDSYSNMAMKATVDKQGIINLSRRHSQSAKVVDFNSWALAWSLFVLYYVHFHGRLQQLMGYFNRATELACRYPWPQFCQYDIMFRTMMASHHNNPAITWDRIDEDLKARHLLNPNPVCYNCLNFGHFSNRCPDPESAFRVSRRNNYSNSNTSVKPSQGGSANNQSGNNNQARAATPTRHCYQFNFGGQCSFNQCKYHHSCMTCGSTSHGTVHCPSR